MSYGLHRKDLDFPFTLGLNRNFMRSSLLARRTGLTVPSLLCVYVLQREGMSGALTCTWCTKLYLCLSYLPLPYLFCSLSCEQTQLNPVLEKGGALVIKHFTSSQIRERVM